MLQWGASEWSVVADVVLAVTALIAGGWAVLIYRSAQKVEAARWLHALFRDFYLEEKFSQLRLEIDHNYESLEPAVLRSIDPVASPLPADAPVLRQLDEFLNFLEYIAYLEDRRHLSPEDRRAMFRYWFDLLADAKYSALRKYLVERGYEYTARLLKLDKLDRLAVYGTLMDAAKLLQIGVRDSLHEEAVCRIRGQLVDLGEYPGLIEGNGTVSGKTYVITDRQALAKLDDYEEVDTQDPAKSLFVRKYVHLVEPDLDCWVYVYNGDATNKAILESGAWRPQSEAQP